MNKKVVAVVVAAGIVMGTSLPAMASPLTNKLNQSKAQLQQSKNDLRNAQKKRQDLEVEVQKLDSKIENLMRETNTVEGKITDTEKNIETTKKRLEEAQKELDKQQAIYNERVRAMYINGADSYFEVLLESESFSDLISRVDMIKSIVSNDKKIIGGLNQKREEVNNKKIALDTEKQKLVALKAENQNKLAKMNENKKEQEKVLAKLVDEENKSKSKVTDSERLVAQARRAVDLAMAAPAPASRPSRGGGYSGGTSGSSSSSSTSNRVVPSSSVGAAVVAEAMKHIGKDYVWGAKGPSNFDCSGLVYYCFKQVGVSVGGSTYSQITQGVPVSRDQLQVGDLVFPHTGHVGIYVGNGNMIHAPHSGATVKIAPIYKFYTARRIR